MGQNLLRIATELVTGGARHGSPSMLMRRLNQDHNVQISFEVARAILAQLYAAGIVGPVDLATHAHPVLLHRDEALAEITSYAGTGPTNWSDLYECPQCCRVAPWTDGRSIAAGDEVDEFWCQACGAEAPVSACAKTVLLAA